MKGRRRKGRLFSTIMILGFLATMGTLAANPFMAGDGPKFSARPARGTISQKGKVEEPPLWAAAASNSFSWSQEMSSSGAAEEDATRIEDKYPAYQKGADPAVWTSFKPPPAIDGRPRTVQYVVKEGDTLWDIARWYATTVEALAHANKLELSRYLRIGQKITVPLFEGAVHPVARGDTIAAVAKLHQVTVDAILAANDVDPERLIAGTVLLIPGGRIPAARTAVPARSASNRTATARAGGTGSTTFQWPLQGSITSPFGWRIHPVYRVRSFHEGIDIAGPPGTPIRAAADGKVSFAGWQGGYGLTVVVDHGGGLSTRYSHNSQNLVQVGEQVAAGQEIARVGSTGVSTGPHVDFGVYINDRPVNPMDYLPR